MEKAKINKSDLIPLYIGITGHRDIRDEDREPLKLKIKEFILEKRKQIPFTPIIILTALAEGADRIAAIAVIECKKELGDNCLVDFIAVLPMPISEYKKDFVQTKSLLEFDILYENAISTIELPFQKDDVTKQHVNNFEIRHEQYYECGLFIARHCHILVALWDGIDNEKKGGTADVVKLKISGIPDSNEDHSKKLKHLQTGPIWHIITPRMNKLVPKNPITAGYYTIAGEIDPSEVEKKSNDILDHINSYNKDIDKFYLKIKDKIANSTNSICKEFAELEENLTIKFIAEKHSTAAELSDIYQKRRFFALKVLLSLVVLAFFFLHSNAEFFHEPTILLLYPLTMGIGAIWYIVAKSSHYEYKHEDYRALAEAYRIQFFLKVCGRKENVTDHYLKRHRGQLEWVLYVLRSSQIGDLKRDISSTIAENEDVIKRLRLLKSNWVEDQLNYFKDKAIAHNKSSKRFESIANISFALAILSACLLFLISYYKEIFPANLKGFEVNLHSTLSCCTSIFLVLAAALHGYSEKMIFAEQAKNYNQMAQLFQLASKKLNQ